MFTRLGMLAGHLSDTKLRISLSVAIAMLTVGLFEFLTEKTLIQFHVPSDLHCGFQATIVGIGAGGSLWLLLITTRERRRVIADELRRVAELNHTIRNSLEVIATAHFSKSKEAHQAMVLESTDRIDKKLRELFPVLGRKTVKSPAEEAAPRS